MPSIDTRIAPRDAAFSGRIALVTGAGSGIGRAAAQAFADRGASVAVVNRNAERGRDTTAAIRTVGGTAEFFQADMAQPEEIDAMMSAVLAHFGRLDIAFNNAGVSLPAPGFLEHSLADWNETIAVNLSSVFLCMQHEIRAMLQTGAGVIINNGSGASMMGAQGLAHYTAAKHGVLGLMKVAAKEFASRNIRINTVCPGVIDTAPMHAFVDGMGHAGDAFLRSLPQGRMGTPDEIARVVVWLCSDDAAYVSGATLVADGGLMCF